MKTAMTTATAASGARGQPSSSPFASLTPPARAETDDEKKKREDEEAAAKKRAEDDEKKKKEDEEAAAAAKKAEADAIQALAAIGGDDLSDKRDERDDTITAVRARERGRIAAILASPAAKANMDQAIFLATTTTMSRATVIALLYTMPKKAAEQPAPSPRAVDPLRDRMADQPKPDIGAGDTKGAEPNLAQQIVLAGKKRRGEAA